MQVIAGRKPGDVVLDRANFVEQFQRIERYHDGTEPLFHGVVDRIRGKQPTAGGFKRFRGRSYDLTILTTELSSIDPADVELIVHCQRDMKPPTLTAVKVARFGSGNAAMTLSASSSMSGASAMAALYQRDTSDDGTFSARATSTCLP